MNKRIKLKKGILKKSCSKKCVFYKNIIRYELTTNNCCVGCKYKNITDKIVDKHWTDRF